VRFVGNYCLFKLDPLKEHYGLVITVISCSNPPFYLFNSGFDPYACEGYFGIIWAGMCPIYRDKFLNLIRTR